MKTIKTTIAVIVSLLFCINCFAKNKDSNNQLNKRVKPIPEYSSADSPLSIGEHYAQVNDVTLHYYVAGKGPVCLVPSPGWGISVDYLYKSLTPFEKYFTMVYYDTRLSGKSTGPDDSTKYSSEDFMNDMDGLRVYLKQPKVWIMGHSNGGFQVLNYGIHHNDKLNGIIAIDPNAGRDSVFLAEHNKAIMKRKGQPYFEKVYAIIIHKDTTHYVLAEKLQITLPFYFHDTLKIKSFPNGNALASDKAAHYTASSHFSTEYLFPELNKIKVPVFVIVGDDDFICDKISQADRIAKDIPSSTEIIIKDAGHFPWIEQPEQFFPKCEKWLQEQHVKKRR